MTTLLLQVVISIQALTFGGVALLVATRMPDAAARYRIGWMTIGVAFAMGGISSAIQDVGAIFAFRAGPDSEVWAEYLRWMPVANHGRAILKITMALVLAYVGWRHPRFGLRYMVVLVAILLAAVMFGGVVGWREGPFRESVHYTKMAVFDTIELMALLVALFVGLVRRTLDRLLWLALILYTFRQALNAIIWSALAWIGIAGAWAPSPLHTHVIGVLTYTVMIGLGIYRLVLGRRGVQVTALFEPPAKARLSFMG